MLNRTYFPYERNSFYPGKLLTARDFEAEQRYMNDKRRLQNRLRGGSGIAAGLGVVRADDASIILQAGCACDAAGREIIVAQTQVVKLSTIEGYDGLKTDSAYLRIRYDEQPAEEVYAVMSGEDGGAQYNKLREGFCLSLIDEGQAPRAARETDAFINRIVIFADTDVEVTLAVPTHLPRVESMRLTLRIARLSAGTGEYAFSCRLEAPGFRFEGQDPGQTDLTVSLDKVKLGHAEERSISLLLLPQSYLWGGGETLLSIEDFAIRRGDEEFAINRRLDAAVLPVDSGLDEFYLHACYGRPMDQELAESYDEPIYLAKLLLLRRGSAVIVDQVIPAPLGQYSYNAQQLMALRVLEELYPCAGRPESIPAAREDGRPAVSVQPAQQPQSAACGVFNLSLGLGADQRGPAFSEEIMHGLGKGPVYVDIGVEYLSPAREDEEVSSEILIGNAALFAGDAARLAEERVYRYTTAVKVLPERGTFIVAVELGNPTGLITLRVRWFAFRLGEHEKRIGRADDGRRMLMVNPDTIVLAPKATAHISPVFVNMPAEACNYRVVDPEGGTVDHNGLYTAPSREGAYEVRVEAVSDPTVYAFAFMIVSQKKQEE